MRQKTIFIGLFISVILGLVMAHKEHTHHEHEHINLKDEKSQKNGLSVDEIWYEAFKATTTITLGGNAAILALLYFEISDVFLKRMVSFAVGGLLGDVILHLIPHAIMSEMSRLKSKEQDHHDHGHSDHDHFHAHDVFNSVGIAVLSGILVFFVIEKLLQSFNLDHSHSHGHIQSKESSKKRANISLARKVLEPGVLLNLVTDFAHNFTDGLALAAAFQFGNGMGEAMTLAITLHEIPHELGDFAVLLNNGLSKSAAFGLQFVSALGAFSGCLFGLMFSPDNSGMILAFTGGGFIYVATTSLLNDLISERSTFSEALIQTFFIMAGIYAMLLIGELEEEAEHNH